MIREYHFVCRFVYGQAVKKLHSVPFSIQVYKFAEEMQIKGLTKELDKLFKGLKAGEIFQVFNMYSLINNQAGIAFCKKVS
jgi:hypothetical protein